MPAKIKKKYKRKRNPVRTGIGIIILIIIVLALKNMISLEIENRRLIKENRDLKKQEAELNKKIENADEQAYVEEKARKELKLIKPGEKIFMFPGDEEDKDEEKEEN